MSFDNEIPKKYRIETFTIQRISYSLLNVNFMLKLHFVKNQYDHKVVVVLVLEVEGGGSILVLVLA